MDKPFISYAAKHALRQAMSQAQGYLSQSDIDRLATLWQVQTDKHREYQAAKLETTKVALSVLGLRH